MEISTQNSQNSFSSFSHFIIVKLTHENFPIWKAQVTPYLRAHSLFLFVDVSNPCPLPIIPRGAPNPTFATWQAKDQLDVAILTASLSEIVLAQVIECDTSAKIWSHLHELFAARSSAQIVHTRLQLASLKKGSESVSDFFNKAKSLTTLLVAAGQSISDTEFITYLLAGLGTEYDSVVTSLST